MANPFYVSPLGGLDLGRQADKVFAGIERGRLREQEEAQAAKQAQVMELAQKAIGGDIEAAQQVYLADPNMGAQVDKALGIQSEAQRRQAAGFFEQYLSLPKGQARTDFLQRTAGKTPFTLDDDLLAMDEETRDRNAMLASANYLSKDQLAMLQGGAGDKPTPAQADFNYYQELKKRDPAAAESFGMAKGYVQTGREAAPTTAQRDWKEYQKLKKESPEDARLYGQAAGFISKEGRELSAHLQKRLSNFTDEAAESSANEIKYNDLAEQIIQAGDDIGSGFFEAGWGEKLKEFTGDSDWKTQLRKDVQQIKVSEGIKNLPQGPATDKDIELVMKPFPPDTASAEYIASYLRGLAKLSNYRKQYNDFRANYVSENGTERGMLKAWREEGITPEVSQREQGFTEAQTQIRNVGRFQVQEVN